MRTPLYALLDILASHPPHGRWQSWQFERVAGGHNNLLYHAWSDSADLAVKFARRDERDRAGREFAALALLSRRGLELGPAPVLLECERYALPLVVQSWQPGERLSGPPATEQGWGGLLAHYAAIHTVAYARADQQIKPAVLNFACASDGCERVAGAIARMPDEAWSAELRELRARFERRLWPEWPPPRMVLCRVDPNPTNFVFQGEHCWSVDWENSGWGDPAFEIGDLLAHPAMLDVPGERRRWVAARYAELSGVSSDALRAWAYFCLMVCDWAFFFARKAFEYRDGRRNASRLVDRPESWYTGLPDQRDAYVRLALELYGAPG
jgi:Ser/Thr protein kinase RdoA (MazF antagonist)